MKISFYNLGCKVNFAETAQLQDNFRKSGFEIVDFDSESDIVFINTCTVTHKADADSRKIIRRAIRQNPGAFIAVGGCYAQLSSDLLKDIDGIDALFGADEKFRINELISDFSKRDVPEVFISDKDHAEFYPACSADSNLRMRAVLKIQDGCDYFCTYCAVPHARGRSRSMPFDQVIPFLHDIEQQDYKEVVLTGINLGDYRYEGKIFADVLNMINQEKLDLRIRISSLEPDLIDNKIIEIVANSINICPHFHIPLQSGSDEILKSMRRRYDTKYFKELIENINTNISGCGIGIDVIVGFPGETEAHFHETYNFLNDLQFSYLHVFSYSDRKVALASKMSNKVNDLVKKERTRMLLELSDMKTRAFIEKNIGTYKVVIPETYEKTKKQWHGWTENYIKTVFTADENLVINPYKVKLINLNKDNSTTVEKRSSFSEQSL